MHLDLTDAQRALRDEVRGVMERLMTPALQQELQVIEAGGPEYMKALQQLGADGWLGLSWPKAFGGQERPPTEQFIFVDEVQRAGYPLPFLTLNTVGPSLMQFGSDEQRAEYLPRILAGRCHFSIGYTEPQAGTDLASLTTRAVPDGDELVIDGQKIFMSLADHADYIWLAARTEPDAPKHKGISIIIVPADADGVSMTPIGTLGDNSTFAVYLEGVRVPASNVVGRLHGGWRLITTQLNHERISLVAPGPTGRALDETTAWARSQRLPGGQRVIDLPWVQRNLAKVAAGQEALRLLTWQQAWALGQGALDPAAASAVKVFGSEYFVEAYHLLMEVLGAGGAVAAGSPGALLRGRLERHYRATLVLTFGGGVNEVQRDIIATVGLGMPRPPR